MSPESTPPTRSEPLTEPPATAGGLTPTPATEGGVTPTPETRPLAGSEPVHEVPITWQTAGNLSPTPDTRTDAVPSGSAFAEPSSVIEGFAIERLHAEGGMGRVWIARDLSLQRYIAFKDLRPRYAGDSGSCERFVREALVTGHLEHPGIVPVYHLGTKDEAGEPFYAMRFVQGRTLTEVIRDHHKHHMDDVVKFRELLSAFVAVCNAIAYAHSRGVLHRDLKPANIIIGDFGEVVVLDWGLAKLIETSEVPAALTLPTNGTDTHAGAIVGTPAYMSPEQADGQPVDERTDVYGLGAVLYELLTNRLPCGGSTVTELLEAVRAGRWTAPRQIQKGISPALDAICCKSLAMAREQRYASVADLATDVRRWLADEPVSAYREPLSARVRRWGRKHRSLVTGLSALVLTATLGLILGLLAVEGQRRETKRALERVTEEEKKTSAALDRSQKAEKSASEQRQLALETVRRVVNRIDARLKDVPAQQKLRKELLKEAQEGLQNVARAVDTAAAIDHATIGIHLELGDLFLNIEGATKSAEDQYQRAHSLATEVAQADPQSASAQRDLSISLTKLGDVQLRREDSKSALASYAQALKIDERRIQDDPQNAQAQRDLAVCLSKLGDVQLKLGDSIAALSSAEKSLVFLESLLRVDPQSIKAQRDLSIGFLKLGKAQLQVGQVTSAIDSFNKNVRITDRLAQIDPTSIQAQRDLSLGYMALGDAQMRLGNKDSLLSHKKSLEICEELAKADPLSFQIQRDLFVGYCKLGVFHHSVGEFSQAARWYRKSLEITEDLNNSNLLANEIRVVQDRLAVCEVADKVLEDPTSVNKLSDDLRASVLSTVAFVLIKQQTTAPKALQAAELLVEHARDGRDIYNAACIVSQCVLLTEKSDEREKHAARAVALLKQAVDKGYKNVSHMKNNSDLDPLRSRDDFKKWFAELEAKSTK